MVLAVDFYCLLRYCQGVEQEVLKCSFRSTYCSTCLSHAEGGKVVAS
jgi:hypothetical protein